MLGWAVHVTACGLLAIAVVGMLREDRAGVAVGGVLLGLLYAVGPAVQGRAVVAPVWLGLVTGGWVVLAVAAPAFVWVAFPLLYAYLSVLPLWGAMFGVAVLTSAAIVAAAWHAGELTTPLLVGPGVAAVVVTLLALACKALRAEADRE
uniref:Two component system histidine kinase n=2 Tax=Nonomuraea gerenzanensis TaxID=93944 RepID=A0A1M4DYY6_9ACTN|nr:two component system histidine kinase [Nonomuraea gerenzanensis]